MKRLVSMLSVPALLFFIQCGGAVATSGGGGTSNGTLDGGGGTGTTTTPGGGDLPCGSGMDAKLCHSATEFCMLQDSAGPQSASCVSFPPGCSPADVGGAGGGGASSSGSGGPPPGNLCSCLPCGNNALCHEANGAYTVECPG